MEKQSHNKMKISSTILCMIFSILFILSAFPTTAQARPADYDGTAETSIGQTLNLGSFSANETDESSNEQAGYLYWAASGDRSGIYYYVVDNYGWIRANGIIMDDSYGDNYGRYCTSGRITASSKLGSVSTLGLPEVKYVSNVSPVYYSGGWQSKGSESMAYLTEIVGDITIKGVKMDCPRWAYLVGQQSGSTGAKALEELAKPDTKWNIFVEPVSVGYMYTDETFSEETANTVHTDKPFAAGSSKPVGTANADGSFTPKVYGTTASSLLSQSVHIGDTGRYRYKFYETQLPFSLCLDHDTDSYLFTGGSSSVKIPVTKCDKSVQRISYIAPHEGIAIASIDITGFAIPPLHTFDGTNTPGNTEPPSPDNGTDGDCTIKKLYYTQKISSDGTILEEATDYNWFEQTGTTAYISIDAEEGYEIEGWKASTTNTSLTTKAQFNSITPTHTGTSSQEILLDKDAGEKYLYIIYKKTEIEENPPQPYDFQLQQSQITKRVSFMTPDANSTTQQLFTHNFTWTASAPTQTSCTSHGGNGHHLGCGKSEHSHGSSCYSTDVLGNSSLDCSTDEHSHSNSCYDTPCTSWQWTDNTTSLGITLDTTSINKAVVSKNDSITYNQPAVNTITTSNKYYKDNTSTRSGTSQNTQSISNFNYITVLFRGQDHLTLADWKNGGAISYLTNLASLAGFIFLHIFRKNNNGRLPIMPIFLDICSIRFGLTI